MEHEIPNDYTGFDGKGWLCDVCGKPIRIAGDGLLQWLEVVGKKGVLEFRLTHTSTATPPENHHPCDTAFSKVHATYFLTQLLGPAGLQELLSFAASPDWPLEEVLEMTKRLHTPGYEHQRFEQDEIF